MPSARLCCACPAGSSVGMHRSQLADVAARGRGCAEMKTFQETVQTLVAGMNKHAARIEAAKLKALGQRNRVESEKEVRKIRRNELESLIKDKKDLLERLELQVLALCCLLTRKNMHGTQCRCRHSRVHPSDSTRPPLPPLSRCRWSSMSRSRRWPKTNGQPLNVSATMRLKVILIMLNVDSFSYEAPTAFSAPPQNCAQDLA